jgi:hypothetical protein
MSQLGDQAAGDPTAYLDPAFIDVGAIKATFGASNGWVAYANPSNYRFTDGAWSVPGAADGNTIQFGQPGDIAVAGFYLPDYIFPWGLQELLPSQLQLAVFRPSDGTFYIDTNSQSFDGANSVPVFLATQGDLPLPVTISESCIDDPSTYLGVYRPRTGMYYVDLNNVSLESDLASVLHIEVMSPGDLPLSAMFSGCGHTWFHLSYATKASGYLTTRSVWMVGNVVEFSGDYPTDPRSLAQFLNTGTPYFPPY